MYMTVIPHLAPKGLGHLLFRKAFHPAPFLGSRSARYRFNRLKQKEGEPSRSSATCPKVTPKNCEICIFIFRQLYGIIKTVIWLRAGKSIL